MIDVTAETLIALRDVPAQLPARKNGRPIHISAVYRWVQRGVRGVRLESVRIGGTTYTSKEALQRFAEEAAETTSQAPSSAPPTTRRRQREIEAAQRRVEAILWSRPNCITSTQSKRPGRGDPRRALPGAT